MNPPKITRPPEKPVEHTFPAWYRNRHTDMVFLATTANAIHGCYGSNTEFVDATDESEWERLPSGTEITFTQP